MDSWTVDWLEQTSSTSTLAKAYLATKPASIKAFAARIQTDGAGCQGRQWQSLEGNLHLSLAVPGALVPMTMREVIPLFAGVVAANWIEQNFGVRPVLKWPNDIVVNGCKVGGILCEATVTGSEWNGVVIGVGINIAKFPLLTDGYDATSLLQSNGRSMAPRSAADSLANALWTQLQQTGLDVLKQYEALATARGHLWRDDQGHWSAQAEFSSQGHLCLVDHNQEQKVLVSSDHQWQWSAMVSPLLAVADVGNSRTKIGLLQRVGNSLSVKDVLVTDFSENTASLVEPLNSWIAMGCPPVVHLSSVNHEQGRRLKKILSELGFLSRPLQKNPIRNLQSQYNIDQMGFDRFAAVEAALYLRNSGNLPGALVIASCGTATTLDFISTRGIHEGGLIGVGVGSGLRTLGNVTDALPKMLEFSHSSTGGWKKSGTGTEEAMSLAAVRMTAAWIDRESVEYARAQGLRVSDVTMVICGGHSKDVAALLNDQGSVRVMPDLVLLGAGLLAMGGR